MVILYLGRLTTSGVVRASPDLLIGDAGAEPFGEPLLAESVRCSRFDMLGSDLEFGLDSGLVGAARDLAELLVCNSGRGPTALIASVV